MPPKETILTKCLVCVCPSIDSKSTDAVVNQLKVALDEQEQVMTMQDMHTKTLEASAVAASDKLEQHMLEQSALKLTNKKAAKTSNEKVDKLTADLKARDQQLSGNLKKTKSKSNLFEFS